jgi:hypothetical protein
VSVCRAFYLTLDCCTIRMAALDLSYRKNFICVARPALRVGDAQINRDVMAVVWRGLLNCSRLFMVLSGLRPIRADLFLFLLEVRRAPHRSPNHREWQLFPGSLVSACSTTKKRPSDTLAWMKFQVWQTGGARSRNHKKMAVQLDHCARIAPCAGPAFGTSSGPKLNIRGGFQFQ